MKILVIDDEPKIRRGLKNLIEKIEPSAMVYSAEDGLDALELLKTLSPDIIFVDIKMPNLNGIEFIKEVRESQNKAYIIIVSGYGEFEYAQAAIEYNVTGYVLKPVNPSKIIEVLGKIKEDMVEKNKSHQDRFALRNKLFSEVIQQASLSTEIHREKLEELEVKREGLLVLGQTHLQQKELKEKLDQLTSSTCTYKCQYLFTPIEIEGSQEQYVLLLFHCEHLNLCHKHMSDQINKLQVLQKLYTTEVFETYTQLRQSIGQLIQQVVRTSGEDTNSFVIEAVKNYIHEHYKQKIKLADIAESVYLTPAYISDLFKKKTGENISDYIVRLRIQKAKEMLMDPSYKIYMIADEIGFGNEKYFSKVFKEYVGVTPNQYRRK